MASAMVGSSVGTPNFAQDRQQLKAALAESVEALQSLSVPLLHAPA